MFDRLTPHAFAVAALIGASLAAPAAASAAGSASFDGTTVHVTEASPGEVNNMNIARQTAGWVEITDVGTVIAGAGCQPKSDSEPDTAICPLTSGGVVVDTGAGDDHVGTYVSAGLEWPDGTLQVSLGDGKDSFIGSASGDIVDGGPGVDDLVGKKGGDTLDGGPGDDKLTGNEGGDVLRGGDGSDVIYADGYDTDGIFADVIDGGAGIDELNDYKGSGPEAQAPGINLSLDGVANDGRPGEGDNIVNIERFTVSSAGSFTGDDADNVFYAPETGAAGTYRGMGGNDQLYAGDANGDVLDGGTGDDELSGGFGDDTLTGGPGKDVIASDRPGRCNEIHCDWGGGFGNDTVEARDGEVDSISCGPGTDTVRADPADVVGSDCETVDRGGTGGDGGNGGNGGPTSTGKATVAVGSAKNLKKVLKGGLVVKVKGATAGARIQGKLVLAGATAKKLRLTRKAKAVTIASGSATASATGAATLKVKFSAAARKRLARAKRVSVSLRVTGAKTRTVKLGR